METGHLKMNHPLKTLLYDIFVMQPLQLLQRALDAGARTAAFVSAGIHRLGGTAGASEPLPAVAVEMKNMKLQSALEEVTRLCASVRAYRAHNPGMPDPDSEVGRALFQLEAFNFELQKLKVAKVLDRPREIDRTERLKVISSR